MNILGVGLPAPFSFSPFACTDSYLNFIAFRIL